MRREIKGGASDAIFLPRETKTLWTIGQDEDKCLAMNIHSLLYLIEKVMDNMAEKKCVQPHMDHVAR
jgi:hypothetical protein